MFPDNLMRDLAIAVVVLALLVGMAVGVLVPKAWNLVKPIIHEATAAQAHGGDA